jgi:hypothetical protein
VLIKSRSSKALSNTNLKQIKWLALGDRGVGKTTFLLSIWCQLHSDSEGSKRCFLDACGLTRDKFERGMNYVRQTGDYPTATMRFDQLIFDVKQSQWWGGEKTVGQIQWIDSPGERCQQKYSDFLEEFFKSDAFFVFINIEKALFALNTRKSSELEKVFAPVLKLAGALGDSSPKPIAVIFTCVDRLQSLEQICAIKKLETTLTEYVNRANSKLPLIIFESQTKIIPTVSGYTLSNKECLAPIFAMGRYFGLLDDSTFKFSFSKLSLSWLIGGVLATGLLGVSLLFSHSFKSSSPVPNTIYQFDEEKK